MLISPFRLTALAEWKTIYILKRVVEGQNYDYDTIVITKFAAIWNKVYNGWVQEFPLAKGFAEARFHLSYALFSSFDDYESFVIWWCILFHWWGSLHNYSHANKAYVVVVVVLWGSFVTLLGSIPLSDSAYDVSSLLFCICNCAQHRHIFLRYRLKWRQDGHNIFSYAPLDSVFFFLPC